MPLYIYVQVPFLFLSNSVSGLQSTLALFVFLVGLAIHIDLSLPSDDVAVVTQLLHRGSHLESTGQCWRYYAHGLLTKERLPKELCSLRTCCKRRDGSKEGAHWDGPTGGVRIERDGSADVCFSKRS